MAETTETPSAEPTAADAKEERIIITTTINGREVKIRSFEATQFAQMSHEAAVLQDARLPWQRKSKSLDRVFRVITTAILDEDDRSFIEDEMADSKLDIVSLTREILDAMRGQSKADETPKVRRGAPRRR